MTVHEAVAAMRDGATVVGNYGCLYLLEGEVLIERALFVNNYLLLDVEALERMNPKNWRLADADDLPEPSDEVSSEAEVRERARRLMAARASMEVVDDA